MATQGPALLDNWVTEYILQFSNNNTKWEPYKVNGTTKVDILSKIALHSKYDLYCIANRLRCLKM